MSEPEPPRDTWSALLSDLQSRLQSTLLSHETRLIPDEKIFHTAFVDACSEAEERDHQRLLARFLRQHAHIIAFVGPIDGSIDLPKHLCLSSLFWSLAFAAFQAALQFHKKQTIFEGSLPTLNEVLPAFGAQLSLFPSVPQVQKPLQAVYREYIDCYSTMLSQLSSRPTSLPVHPFNERINRAQGIFHEAKTQWEEKVKIAQQEAQSRFDRSLPSYANGTLGPEEPYVPSSIAWEWLESLGQGSYGQVSKVKQRSTGSVYAQKVIWVPDPKLKSLTAQKVKNEVSVMEKLRHHHITSIVFCIPDEDRFSILILPVADYDLLRFLRRSSFSTTDKVRLSTWFGCLVSALAFAHARGVKHEDIKPTNILIKDHQPYLADFGCAKDISGNDLSISENELTFGTPVYWAPERPPRGRAGDVFSLGCVFSEMLTIRQGRTLQEYQEFRYLPNRDNPYAFRENLPKVNTWLEESKHPGDPLSDLLIEQTRSMLKKEDSRGVAKHIARDLQRGGTAVFCTTCF